MNVPRFVDVTMSMLPSLLSPSRVTCEPTPDLLWINSGTNSAPPGARGLRTVRNQYKHRVAVRVRIDPALLVREQPLAGHEVGNPIAIHVGHRRAVHLRDGDAARVPRRIVVDDHVAIERDVACGIALLLEPGEPEPVGIQTRDDVVETIAVHVEDDHLGAAGAFRAAPPPERIGVVRPKTGARSGGRLLPPSRRLKDIDSSVAIHIAGAKAMTVRGPGLRDRVRRPRRRRVGGIGPTERERAADAACAEDDLGLAVAVDVAHERDLAGDLRQHRVFGPAPMLPFRVDIKVHRPRLAGEHVGSSRRR